MMQVLETKYNHTHSHIHSVWAPVVHCGIECQVCWKKKKKKKTEKNSDPPAILSIKHSHANSPMKQMRIITGAE